MSFVFIFRSLILGSGVFNSNISESNKDSGMGKFSKSSYDTSKNVPVWLL